MRILDRYLTRHLIIPISFCSLTLISLVLIADVFDHLNDFVRNETPLLSILKYYLFLIPFSFVETIAWATLLGTIYLLVTTNTHNEILAMKASGLSISMITRPILYTGFLIGMTSFIVGNELLPTTFRKAQAISETEITKKADPGLPPETIIKNLTYYGLQNRLYYAKSFNPQEQSFEDLIILFFSEFRRVNRKIFCRRARWEGNAWKLYEVTDYETNTQGKILGEPRVYKERVYSELSEPPSAFIEAAREQYYLSYHELKNLVRRLEDNNLKALPERTHLHFKLSSPWHGLIMMLLAIPLLSITQTRKTIALNLLVLLALVFGFHVIGAVSMALGKEGIIPPAVGAWSNCVLFAIGSIYFHNRANH